MFYSQDILQKRGGKFGIVWLAATEAARLTRRDYFSVNVVKTCEDISKYIMLQAEPVVRGGARPRFSLYLSAQLMYGVIKVYDMQCHYLFADTSAISKKFKSSLTSTLEIDLRAVTRPQHVNTPDIVAHFKQVVDVPAFDPDFGTFRSAEAVEWEDFIDVDMFQLQPSPRIFTSPVAGLLGRQDVSLPITPQTPTLPFRAEAGGVHQAEEERITLKEDLLSPIIDDQITGEKDLPPPVEGDFEIVLDEDPFQRMQEEMDEIQALQPRLEDIPGVVLPPKQTPMLRAAATEAAQQMQVELDQPPQTTEVTEEQTTEDEFNMMDLDLHRLYPAEETPAMLVDPDLLLMPGAPVHGPPHSPGITPVQGKQKKRMRLTATMELSPITPSPVTRRRRRQLAFADEEMQISKKQLRLNLLTGEYTCKKFELARFQTDVVTDLFNQPGKKELRHPSLLPLWRRNARTMGLLETDSDRERPAWTVPFLESTSGESDADRGSPILQPLLPVPPLSPVQEEVDLPREGDLTTSLHPSLAHISALSAADVSRESIRDISDNEGSRHGSLRLPAVTPGQDDSSLQVSRLRQTLDDELATLHEVPEEHLPHSPQLQDRSHSPQLQDRSPASPDRLGDLTITEATVHQQLLRILRKLTRGQRSTTFKAVCPLTSSKTVAACMFTALLDIGAQHKVHLTQEEVFGDIFIYRGHQW